MISGKCSTINCDREAIEKRIVFKKEKLFCKQCSDSFGTGLSVYNSLLKWSTISLKDMTFYKGLQDSLDELNRK